MNSYLEFPLLAEYKIRVRKVILLTGHWSGPTPSSAWSLLCAAFLTPAPPAASFSSASSARGWLQHVFVHRPGNVILAKDLRE